MRGELRPLLLVIAALCCGSTALRAEPPMPTFIQAQYGDYGDISYMLIDPNTGHLIAGGLTEQPGNWLPLSDYFYDAAVQQDRWHPGAYQIDFYWRAPPYFASGSGLVTYLGRGVFAGAILVPSQRGPFLALPPIRLSLR